MITDEMVERFVASYFPRGKTYSSDLVREALKAAIGDMVLVPRDVLKNADIALGISRFAGDKWSPNESPRWELREAIAASQPPDAGEGREGS